MNKKIFTVCLAFVSVLSILFYSCHKENGDATGIYGLNNTEMVSTTIVGTVVDENNLPLQGVAVTVEGKTYSTTDNGHFLFTGISVPKMRCLISATGSAFINSSVAVIPSGGSVTYVKVMMINLNETATFSSAAGMVLTLAGGGEIIFPAGVYINAWGHTSYTGVVNVNVRYLKPSEADFGMKIPGRDLLARSAAGANVILTSFGMMTVELKGDYNQKLLLPAATVATLKFPIDASQQASAPTTIPLWHFDEATSLWKEEGQAVRNGNTYTADVNHFSWWNCDNPCLKAYIEGKVVDCSGTPLSDINVSVNNRIGVFTDQDGKYSGWVPANTALNVQILSAFNSVFVSNSQIESIDPIPPDQTITVPDLRAPCPARIAGTIRGCDLSSIVPALIIASWNGGSSVYYSNNGTYNMPVLENTDLTIKFISGNAFKEINTTSSASGVISSVGNISLCDNTAVQPDNSYYINGYGHNNELVVIDTTSTSTLVWSGGFRMTVRGYNNANGLDNYMGIFLDSFDTIPGTYQMNSITNRILVYYSYGDPAQAFETNTFGANAVCTITSTQEGRVKGVFWGEFTDSLNIPVTINGKFNVVKQF